MKIYGLLLIYSQCQDKTLHKVTFSLSLCVFLVQMKKGNTIQNFLQRALEVLRKDFSELR